MKYKAVPNQNCKCVRQMYAIERDGFPAGTKLPCKPCLVPGFDGNPFTCCCNCFSLEWPGFTASSAVLQCARIENSPKKFWFGTTQDQCRGQDYVWPQCTWYDPFYPGKLVSLRSQWDSTLHKWRWTLTVTHTVCGLNRYIIATYTSTELTCSRAGVFTLVSVDNQSDCGSIQPPPELTVVPEADCSDDTRNGYRCQSTALTADTVFTVEALKHLTAIEGVFTYARSGTPFSLDRTIPGHCSWDDRVTKTIIQDLGYNNDSLVHAIKYDLPTTVDGHSAGVGTASYGSYHCATPFSLGQPHCEFCTPELNGAFRQFPWTFNLGLSCQNGGCGDPVAAYFFLSVLQNVTFNGSSVVQLDTWAAVFSRNMLFYPYISGHWYNSSPPVFKVTW